MNSIKANALHGIGFAVLATACFATLDTTTRHVSAGLSVLVALWFRYAIQAVITTVVVWPGRGRQILRTQHPRFQLARGLLLFACSILAFLSLKYMPVGEFTAITLLAPLVITLLAAWMLKEKIRPLRWLLVLGGFIGTLIIIRPGSQHFDWTVVLPLMLVGTNAGFQLLTSKMSKTEDPITTHFYTGCPTNGLLQAWAWSRCAGLWGLGSRCEKTAAPSIHHNPESRSSIAGLWPHLYCILLNTDP